MVDNEILEEVWRNRDAFAERHHYDLDAMVEELRQMERRSTNKLVDRSEKAAKEPKPADPRARRTKRSA